MSDVGAARPSVTIERQILQGMLVDGAFLRKAGPYLHRDHFVDEASRAVFDVIKKHVDTYNAPPTRESMLIAVDALEGVRQQAIDGAVVVINDISSASYDAESHDWLVAVSYTHLRAHETPEHLVCRVPVVGGFV